MAGRCLLHHLNGNPNVRQAALGLHEAGLLGGIATMLGFRNAAAVDAATRLMPGGLGRRVRKELLRRSWDLPDAVPFHAYPWRELFRTIPRRLGLAKRMGYDERAVVMRNSVWLDETVARRHLGGIDAVYGYEDMSASTFAAAKARGITCLYDLPIMHYASSRRIMQEEIDRFPEHARFLYGVQDPPAKLTRKDKELELADHVIVASSLTRNSLTAIGYPADRITVIPYGSPTNYFQPAPRTDDTFRAIFVGLVGPRKGVHYLLKAWREMALPKAELLLVGTRQFSDEWFERETKGLNVRHVPSVPHHTLGGFYTSADLFVFPSLIEGFGLVLLEAMSCGLPVLTTPHTAGPDIVAEGRDGFIVPIRDVEALKDKLSWAHAHRAELAAMGVEARRTAERLSWAAYRQATANKVAELMARQG